MKKLNYFTMIALLSVVILASCAKDNKEVAQQVVSTEVLNKISALGFGSKEVQVLDEGYLVEGDIMLTPADLERAPESTLLRIAETEQYHTFELVTAPRAITIKTQGNFNSNSSDAIDNAIDRYNAENLDLTFVRLSHGKADIVFKLTNSGNFIAYAGFPSGGEPYDQVVFNKQYKDANNEFLTSVFAHEIGHCIGFRHTDYMDRSFSCGGYYSNEGEDTYGIGAVLIPGTPSDPEEESWMLSCSAGNDRPFTTNDIIALNYLY